MKLDLPKADSPTFYLLCSSHFVTINSTSRSKIFNAALQMNGQWAKTFQELKAVFKAFD